MSFLTSIRFLFMTSRPVSWPNTAFPFAAGYLLSGGSVDLRFFIGTIFFLIPYNLLMYGINDVFDYESDIKNPRKGGIEGAVISKSYHPLIILTSVLSCLPFVFALAFMSPLIGSLVLATVLFFVVAYSLKGLRFKEIPLLDSFTSSMHFVGPLLFALSLHGFPQTAWPYVLAFFLWGMASQAFGAVQDIVPDRESNISSIATVLGAKATVRTSMALYLAAVLILLTTDGIGSLSGVVAFAYCANVAPFINLTDLQASLARAGWKRFLWINYLVGMIITWIIILYALGV